jgi:hypothetical protein
MTAAWEQRIETKLDELLTASARMTAAGENRQRMIDEHHEALFGNGKPGIKADVQTLKDTVFGIKEFCASTHKPCSVWSRIWPPVVSTILAAVLLTVAAFAMGMWRLHSETPKAGAAQTTTTNAPK